MSFKYGYMTQRSAFFAKAGQAGRNPTGAKRGSRAALQGSPLPLQRNFLAKRTSRPEMLDSSASRDQVNDSNNQSDHQ
jgi:hypothetical protein